MYCHIRECFVEAGNTSSLLPISPTGFDKFWTSKVNTDRHNLSDADVALELTYLTINRRKLANINIFAVTDIPAAVLYVFFRVGMTMLC